MGFIVVGGDFVCCLIIVVIFIGLGGDFEVTIWGDELERHRTIFMGKVDPSRHHVKILIW